MNIRFLLLTTLLCSSLLLAKGGDRSVEDIREEAQERLEEGVEKAGVGGVSLGVGAFRFSRGDLLGGATGVSAGAVEFKASYNALKKSKKLFDEAREQERSNNENSSCDDVRDRVDSWDYDY